jgi:DNA-binding NarL/FixJ family response regulator
MSDTEYEPFVFLDRSEAPAPSGRRWTVFRGRKPALLLIDRGGASGDGLDPILAEEGFEVYQTTNRKSALDLLKAHPSILMALVRIDLPGLDAASVIRELRSIQPGLWVGMLADFQDRKAAAEGYVAGAADLFYPKLSPTVVASRLVRSAPLALRLREGAERRVERTQQRPRRRWLRRVSRRLAPHLGMAVLLVLAFLAGSGLAAATRLWQDAQARWAAQVDRLVQAIEAASPARPMTDRQIERLFRAQELDLQRQAREDLRIQQSSREEEERRRDILRTSPPPQYPAR